MEITDQEEKRIYWIDAARFLAIIAVLVDHTNGILYENQNIAFWSYFSVSLFIFLMGVTSYWSLNKGGETKKNIGIKCWGIIRPYLVATFVYYIFIFKSFDLENYVDYIIHFNISGPFYYVLLYVQLVISSPIIYRLIHACDKGWLKSSLFWGSIVVIASLTTNYTNIMSVYGGGGKLLGGTYLILFCIGMLFAKNNDRIQINRRGAVAYFTVTLAVTIEWCRFVQINRGQIDNYFPFGHGFNPPSVSFCIYAILVAFTLFFFEKLLLVFELKHVYRLFRVGSFWGRFTLHIFLYHRLFLDIIFPLLRSVTGMVIGNMWIKSIVYMLVMILWPILIGWILDLVYYFLVKFFQIIETPN